jgi:hypothetical protein
LANLDSSEVYDRDRVPYRCFARIGHSKREIIESTFPAQTANFLPALDRVCFGALKKLKPGVGGKIDEQSAPPVI